SRRRGVPSPRTRPAGPAPPRALTSAERIQFEGLIRFQRDIQEQGEKFQVDLDIVAGGVVQRLVLAPDTKIGVGVSGPGITHVVSPADWHLHEAREAEAVEAVEANGAKPGAAAEAVVEAIAERAEPTAE